MSGQDKWLGKPSVVITKLGYPPGTSKALQQSSSLGVSAAARANQVLTEGLNLKIDMCAREATLSLIPSLSQCPIPYRFMSTYSDPSPKATNKSSSDTDTSHNTPADQRTI